MAWVTLSHGVGSAFAVKISKWWGTAWARCWRSDCQLPSEGLGSPRFEEDRCNYPPFRADNELTVFPMPPWFSSMGSIIADNEAWVYLNCDVNKIEAWAGTASGTEAGWVTQMPQPVTENSGFGLISRQPFTQQPPPISWEQQGQARCALSEGSRGKATGLDYLGECNCSSCSRFRSPNLLPRFARGILGAQLHAWCLFLNFKSRNTY